jgi:hypothetical protein
MRYIMSSSRRPRVRLPQNMRGTLVRMYRAHSLLLSPLPNCDKTVCISTDQVSILILDPVYWICKQSFQQHEGCYIFGNIMMLSVAAIFSIKSIYNVRNLEEFWRWLIESNNLFQILEISCKIKLVLDKIVFITNTQKLNCKDRIKITSKSHQNHIKITLKSDRCDVESDFRRFISDFGLILHIFWPIILNKDIYLFIKCFLCQMSLHSCLKDNFKPTKTIKEHFLEEIYGSGNSRKECARYVPVRQRGTCRTQICLHISMRYTVLNWKGIAVWWC